MLLALVGCGPLTLDADSLSELDQGHACPNGSQVDPLDQAAILSKSDETLRVQLFAPNEPDAGVDFIVYTGSRLIFPDDDLCDDILQIGLFDQDIDFRYDLVEGTASIVVDDTHVWVELQDAVLAARPGVNEERVDDVEVVHVGDVLFPGVPFGVVPAPLMPLPSR